MVSNTLGLKRVYYKLINRLSMQQKTDPQDFEKRFRECDDKFNTIFKRTSAASKIIGRDLTILKVNDALAELMGYSASEIEGTKILEHACEDYRKHWHELQMELWSNEVPFFKLQACLYKKDKSLVWVNVTTILFEDQGETYGFTVLDDITALKDFEESQKRLNMALKYSKMAVWQMSLKNNAVHRSEGHDELFGYDSLQPQWTIESYLPLILEEDRPKFLSAIRSLPDHKSMDLQLRLITKDGSLKWVNFQGKIEDDPSGNADKVLGTIADITRDKLAERHKDDFISIASHELKTPITSLKTSLQLLARMQEDLPDRLKALVVQSNRSVDKIVVLVNDLLNASKTYQDQLNLKKTTFNLYKVIEESSGHLRLEGSHDVDISGPSDLMVTADAERIERVIINFLSNAIKYAPNARKVNINIEKTGAEAKVSVTDYGPGIPEAKLSLLFNRHYQAGKLDTQYTGLGLGLFISSEIIKKHGGAIGVDSKVGSGSTFWFTIPL